jgi:hypothetical protein
MDAKNELGQPLLLHGTDDPTTWNDLQQVFPKDGFEDLYRSFKESSAAGDAHVFTRTYEVRGERASTLYRKVVRAPAIKARKRSGGQC